MKCIPHLIGDVAYPNLRHSHKNRKTKNPLEVEKKTFDVAMNIGKIDIKNAFESLKYRWRILTHFSTTLKSITHFKSLLSTSQLL
jgi:hypothetical protein